MTGAGSGHDAGAVPQAEPGASPRTPALAGRQGSAVARRKGTFTAAQHPSPIKRRGPPTPATQGTLPQARQGSAPPTATPRHHAKSTADARQHRLASPTAVPASRSPLTRRLTTSHPRTPTLPGPIRHLTIRRRDPIIRRIATRTSAHPQLHGSDDFTLTFSLDNAAIDEAPPALFPR